jgi:hypothetical protein
MSALIFAELKMRHISTEYTPEYAKQLVWQEKFEDLNNQYHVSLTQYKMLKCIDGKVDYIITDSPLFLGLFYNRDFENNTSDIIKTECMILDKLKEFNNKYIFLERNETYPFETQGRVHNEQESKRIDAELKKLLEKHNIKFKVFKSSKDSISNIIDFILEK